MTWVVLIPKENDAVEMNQFLPISMVGCLYKIIAKILANRMKEVMPIVVGEAETTFVQKR